MESHPSSRPVIVLASLIVLAAVLVQIRTLLFPMLVFDDFGILLNSWTWDRTYSNLWVPVNEHCWPLTRLTTFAIIQVAGRLSWIPFVAMCFSHVLPLCVMGLTYRFIRIERGHPLYALIAMAVFGISAVYQEAIDWYAASPAMAALATGLLALLSAQRWQRTHSWWALLMTAVWCALAPGWFAGGILIGPLCSIYLFNLGSKSKSLLPCLAPLIGCGAYLGIMLLLSGKDILQPSHLNGQSLAQAFRITSAVENTGRSIVDNVVFGSLGIYGCPMPIAVVIAGLVLLSILWVWLWKRAGIRKLMVLGLAFILLNDVLIFGSRANWSYVEQLSNWSRYNVFPQFGLTLIVSGAMGCLGTNGSSGLTSQQIRGVKILILVLFLLQLPRGVFNGPAPHSLQSDALRQVDDMDRRCVDFHISADDARRVLPEEKIPYSEYSRWMFLRGSQTPQPRSDNELNRILLAP